MRYLKHFILPKCHYNFREQKECGLDKLSPDERLRLRKHNDEYRCNEHEDKYTNTQIQKHMNTLIHRQAIEAVKTQV